MPYSKVTPALRQRFEVLQAGHGHQAGGHAKTPCFVMELVRSIRTQYQDLTQLEMRPIQFPERGAAESRAFIVKQIDTRPGCD
jgi:hypothetical protein